LPLNIEWIPIQFVFLTTKAPSNEVSQRKPLLFLFYYQINLAFFCKKFQNRYLNLFSLSLRLSLSLHFSALGLSIHYYSKSIASLKGNWTLFFFFVFLYAFET